MQCVCGAQTRGGFCEAVFFRALSKLQFSNVALSLAAAQFFCLARKQNTVQAVCFKSILYPEFFCALTVPQAYGC